MREHVNDTYVQLARKEGWRSRAAFKLLEIDDKDKLLKRGEVVVDLGATPGGWSQVASKRVGDGGMVVALDLLEMEPIHNVHFIQGDFREDDVLEQLEKQLGDRHVGLVKVFQGTDYETFLRQMRETFKTVVVRKPDASRDRSAELYLLGRTLR